MLQFSRPKGSGLEISPNFYLTVLAARAQLPPLLVVLNPKGDGGAVPGMGVPLAEEATKKDLAEPIKRGVYALSSPDQKTVLKMMVMPREEAGFDPSAFARSAAAKEWDPELRVRVESTWMILQLTFGSYDPETYPALDFLLSIAKRLAEETDGVVADPVSQVYRLPSQVFSNRPANEAVAASDHVQIKDRMHEGKHHVYTLGLSKFNLPEVELYGVSASNRDTAVRFMLGLAQSVLNGARLAPGASVGAQGSALIVAPGGLDRGLWEGIPCLELIPGEKDSVDAALVAWLGTV